MEAAIFGVVVTCPLPVENNDIRERDALNAPVSLSPQVLGTILNFRLYISS